MRIVLCYELTDQHLAKLQEAAPGHELVNAGQERIAKEILEADVFCGHAKVPVPWAEVVRRGRLRWIQSSASGLDHCLTPEVIASDITVTGASGVFADAVAEQAMALLLAIIRNLPTFFRAQQARQFQRQPTRDLHGSTVGIVGFGGNGRRIAEVLAPFQTRLLATDMFPPPRPPRHVEAVWAADRLDELLRQSDIVILTLPLNDQTRGLFDARRIAQMRQGAILINVARGPIVVENDLVTALRSGHLYGAGLDVTQVEPLPADSQLWDMPNVVITPHVGAQSARRADLVTQLIAENLRRFLAGQPLLNVVDKQLGFPIPDHARATV